jgi:tRNA pseudouridine55 synthase
VKIDSLQLKRQIAEDTFEFDVTCGTGTYVRSLARDIAEACGTVGYVSYLRRIKDGCFSIQDAQPLDLFLNKDISILLDLAGKIGHNAFGIFPLSSVLDDIPAVTVGEDDLKRFFQGQTISVESHIDCSPGIVQVQGVFGLCAMGFIENGQLKPKRLLHLGEYDVDYN